MGQVDMILPPQLGGRAKAARQPHPRLRGSFSRPSTPLCPLSEEARDAPAQFRSDNLDGIVRQEVVVIDTVSDPAVSAPAVLLSRA